MELPIKTLEILKYISRHRPDTQKLKKRFGESTQLRLRELQAAHAINFEFEADGITHTIHPSTEGLLILEDYLAQVKYDRKIDFRRSVRYPILVSLATNLLLAGIRLLLPLIPAWVANTP